MQAASLVIRGFRNLADTTLTFPPEGVTLVGPNGHGKTNLLEALAYPVLFRSLRGALDREVGRFGGPGFHVGLTVADGAVLTATVTAATGQKRITCNDEPVPLTRALGHWLAVALLPTDVHLIQGGAAERRRWLDRLLSLASPVYLEALLAYRRLVAQRNAALRQGEERLAAAFIPGLACHGATLSAARQDWVATMGKGMRDELARLGEESAVTLRYRGREELRDPAQWEPALAASLASDLHRGISHVGPHRDDLVLTLDGHPARQVASTGQQRSAATALRLLEWETLAAVRGARPALLIDDVFATLDRGRQERLGERLRACAGQQIVTAPKASEIPDHLTLPRWDVLGGVVRTAA